jgi:hypothetical protein
MAAARPRFGFGASALRDEHKVLLTGQGQYNDPAILFAIWQAIAAAKAKSA